MNIEWILISEHPEIPPEAEVVALACSSKCKTAELCGKPQVSFFKRFPNGWPKIIGWELYWVVPKELHWLAK